MTELSTETYILYNKTNFQGENVLVRNVRGQNVQVQNIKGRNVMVQKGSERNVLDQKYQGRNNLVRNIRERNVPVQKIPEAKRPGPKSRGEIFWSKMSGGEMSCPKCQWAKRLDPKRLSPTNPGAKTLPEHSLHDFETSSMIVTFPETSL